jgi:hypothetical protein
MKLFMNRFPLSGPGSKPGLLLVLVGVAFLLSGSQSYAARGSYGGRTVAAAGPNGAVVAGPNGAAAVGRNGGVAVVGGYHPAPVYVAPKVVVAGPGGVAVAGPNGAVVVKRSYAPCYPYGYVHVVPTGYTKVYYGGYNCFFVGGVYYRPEFYGGSTVYVVVKL